MVLHGVMPSSFTAAKLVAMYASSGDLNAAISAFEYVSSFDCSSLLYNSVIRAYANYRCYETTVAVYCRMLVLGFKADHFTFPFVLKSCANLSWVKLGECVHGQCLKIGFQFDLYVGTSAIDMYVKCGQLDDARRLFDEMPVRDVSSWNALIAGYMKDGMIDVAESLFMGMPSRNVFSWTAMISGYTQNGYANRALDLFDRMMLENSEVKPNWVTIVSILPACAHSAVLDRGKRIHEICRHNGLDSHSSVQTALIGMYAKCGSLADAKQCFDKISPGNRGLAAWNNMITAYASHGRGRDCVLAFQDMEASGFQPDAITFTALLSGCSHSGLADVGLSYFYSMKNQYSVEPRLEHYACVVDLLSRVGQLVEAKETIDQMPMQPGPSVWGALLAASHRCRNLQIAEIAAKQLFLLEPENTGNYVLLSNMYAEAGKWEEVNNLRVFLKGHGMRKSPGCSWIEINGNAHLFIGGDTAHPQAREIYKLLEELPEKIKTIGYTPNTSFSLHDISEEEKMLSLTTHSEKLAIAFGILNTRTGQVLRVTKNLRICGDCHTFAKFVSDVYKREIIVRDVNRFHHFQDGFCSCGDFW